MLPLKAYTSTFCNAGSAGTSLLGHKQKGYIQNLSLLKELNIELRDLASAFQWTSNSVLTKMGVRGKYSHAGLQQIPSQEQTKDVGRCRGQAFVLNVSWHRGTHKMPVYRTEPCTGTHSLAQQLSTSYGRRCNERLTGGNGT